VKCEGNYHATWQVPNYWLAYLISTVVVATLVLKMRLMPLELTRIGNELNGVIFLYYLYTIQNLTDDSDKQMKLTAQECLGFL